MKIQMSSSDVARILGTVGSPLIVISELIKNSVDASATSIKINYNLPAGEIIISDNGDGFTLDDIQEIAHPGRSQKKVGDSLRSRNGLYLTGSKGLGMLSAFSLCESVKITTCTKTGEQHSILLNKETGEVAYEEVEANQTNEQGTQIVLNAVKRDVLELLMSPVELIKLKHISTYLYKGNSVAFPQILLEVDGMEPVSLQFATEFNEALYDASVSYDRSTQTLMLKCSSCAECGMPNSAVFIKEFEYTKLKETISAVYGIPSPIKTRTNESALTSNIWSLDRLPSFEGRILVYENMRAGAKLKEYGAGVNVYVNEFALYNYLSDENDWLGLADFSQRRKATSLKPHNVYGYINFGDYNENEEELKISNERADFIQDVVYSQFMYIMKGVVLFVLFNIDINRKKKKVNGSDNEESKGSTADNGNSTTSGVNTNQGENSGREEEDEQDSDDQGSGNPPNKDSSTASIGQNEQDGQGATRKESSEDKNEDYTPEEPYKPKVARQRYLTFTQAEGAFVEKLKNISETGDKIYQIVYELRYLDVDRYSYAVASIFRLLIEISTKHAATKYARIRIAKADLTGSVTSAINFFSDKNNGLSAVDPKEVSKWREIIGRRSLTEYLNSYIHDAAKVDGTYLVDAWNTIRSYIIKCII